MHLLVLLVVSLFMLVFSWLCFFVQLHFDLPPNFMLSPAMSMKVENIELRITSVPNFTIIITLFKCRMCLALLC